MNEIPSKYNPKEAEGKWFDFWQKENLFASRPKATKNPFCIVIPPPNVTGILHMGHALNNSIQDILIRFHRMRNDESLWVPGTDHAGIATQNVVEKKLAKEGLTRQDLGRDEFVKQVWQWKNEYGSTIIRQLKRLGSSCDWSRERFTMDEAYSRSVKEAFVRLWNKKLIYQDDKIINWCPRCQTALSDEEAPHQELDGKLYYLKYPLKDRPDGFITVATTRPETMLGDTAVAVNPRDKRYKKLVKKTVMLPLVDRPIKIIADNSIDKDFGTGAVKVTPAHDINDYVLGKKHKLDFINVLNPDGSINKNAPGYTGLDRFKAREKVLEDLKKKNLFIKEQPHKFSAGHCYRCHTIIEPYLSRQWFVRMKPLAKPAIKAVKKGKIKFHPNRWTKVYLNWMENIHDWCISRQIWWGHRIPVWYCSDCNKVFASVDEVKVCKKCASKNIRQEEDVLDTWFSSWLWSFATFYWPFDTQDPVKRAQYKSDLKYYYPTAVLVTAPEIIFFWVARMIMAGFEFMKEAPFKDVYLHGTVRDLTGKKMSKSLGNVIDPLDIIEKYGADALRFSLISITATGQDVFLAEEKFQMGRNFANKIWNASRFVLMNLTSDINRDLCEFVKNEDLDLASRWILSQFYSMVSDLEQAIANYNFNEAANIIYEFFWHKYCDWYLELIKPNINQPGIQLIMYKVLEKSLRVMHPFMPFLTEELWHRIDVKSGSIITSKWPHMQKYLIDKDADSEMQFLISAVSGLRNLRKQINLKESIKVKVTAVLNKADFKRLNSLSGYIKNLANVSEIITSEKVPVLDTFLTTVVNQVQFFIELEGLVDIAKERSKAEKEIVQLEKMIVSKTQRLENASFVKKAPAEVVEKENSILKELKDKLIKWQKTYNDLQGKIS
ncbi:MAG: valine--tRNA ligase [Candidatus Gygaella obscura]|nr:valine--tRNA ligase [Candidatus Gygaella obscura]